MANVVIANQVPSTSLDYYNTIWKLSRALKSAGWTYKSSSDGSTKDTTGTATNDKWGGNANPLNDTYPSFSAVGAWWNAQGPSTLKIPINSANTPGANGGFIRGENITQATTNAQGELLGYLWDGYALQGYLVVAPRVDGSGADPHGWDHTHTITGSISGATIIPSATVIEFVREIVFWKSSANLTQGYIYYQCVDGYSESTSRYSVLAGSAGATGAIAPGGGGTGNAFPTAGSFVISGNIGTPTASNWYSCASANNIGRFHCIATNATYTTNSSADGSFWLTVGQPTVNSGSFTGFGFTRVDSQEDGDVDPYVFYIPSTTALTTATSALRTSDVGAVGTQDFWNPSSAGITSNVTFKFWRRRGMGGTTDIFDTGGYCLLAAGSSTFVITWNTFDRERLANTFSDYYLLDDVWCIGTIAYQKMRKGICRWMKIVQGGSGCDLYGGKLWIQMANSTSTFPGGFVIGPWDGSTVATQA